MNFVFKLKLSSCFLEILEMGKCGCAKCRKRQSGSAKLKGINTEENKGDKQNQIFCYFYWPSRILKKITFLALISANGGRGGGGGGGFRSPSWI